MFWLVGIQHGRHEDYFIDSIDRYRGQSLQVSATCAHKAVQHTGVMSVVFNMKRPVQIDIKLQQRINIHFLQKLGMTLPLTQRFLQQVYGAQCLGERSMRNWYHAFRDSLTQVTDLLRRAKIRRGRSASNIQAVSHMVQDDRRVSIKDICRATTLSYGTVQRILTQDLHLVRKCAKFVPKDLTNTQRNLRLVYCQLYLRKIELDPGFLTKVITMDESWIYMYDPETKRQSTQWMNKHDPRPSKPMRTRATGKVLLISFLTTRDWSTASS